MPELNDTILIPLVYLLALVLIIAVGVIVSFAVSSIIVYVHARYYGWTVRYDYKHDEYLVFEPEESERCRTHSAFATNDLGSLLIWVANHSKKRTS